MNGMFFTMARLLVASGIAVSGAHNDTFGDVPRVEVPPRRVGKSPRPVIIDEPRQDRKGKSDSLKRMLAGKGRK